MSFSQGDNDDVGISQFYPNGQKRQGQDSIRVDNTDKENSYDDRMNTFISGLITKNNNNSGDGGVARGKE